MGKRIHRIYLGLSLVVLPLSQQGFAQAYPGLLAEIAQKRTRLAQAYLGSSATTQDSLILVAEDYLLMVLTDSVFPAWYGTPWDFNGMSRTPGQGKIACGYFVTNVLTDVGFKIPRIRWAQSASEVFIRELCPQVQRFSRQPLEAVEEYLLQSGDGTYLVGLDNHTGFVTVEGNTIRFVHADFYNADTGVKSETLFSDNPLRDSRYRVVGKLFSRPMIDRWLRGEAYQ